MKTVTAKLLDRQGSLVGFCEVPCYGATADPKPGEKDDIAMPWGPEVISLRREGRTFVRDVGSELGRTQDARLMLSYVERTFAWGEDFRLTEKQ